MGTSGSLAVFFVGESPFCSILRRGVRFDCHLCAVTLTAMCVFCTHCPTLMPAAGSIKSTLGVRLSVPCLCHLTGCARRAVG